MTTPISCSPPSSGARQILSRQFRHALPFFVWLWLPLPRKLCERFHRLAVTSSSARRGFQLLVLAGRAFCKFCRYLRLLPLPVGLLRTALLRQFLHLVSFLEFPRSCLCTIGLLHGLAQIWSPPFLWPAWSTRRGLFRSSRHSCLDIAFSFA